jgi:Ca2+-binding RTX toxin-like protein
MALLSPLGLIEVIGTAVGDVLRAQRGAVVFGRQGNDVFTTDRGISADEDQIFFGGSGSDSYVVRPGTSAIIGDGFGSGGDTLRSSALSFNSETTGFAEVDGRHLVIVDVASNTGALVLDWLNPERAIERFEFADGARALSAADVRSHPNYIGSFTAEDVFDSEAGAFRDQMRLSFREARSVESTPQPALLQIIGTPGDDELSGDARAESITGLAGDDTIRGNGGNDRLIGGGGADAMDGGPGGDALSGGAGNDRLDGGPGRNHLQGGAGNDLLFGRGEADSLIGAAGDDQLQGGAGDDVMSGGRGDDAMTGDIGNDLIQGGAGGDEADGGPGDDRFEGGGGPDLLIGGGGADRLDGGNGNDELRGDGGPDLLIGGGGADLLIGGGSADKLDGGNDNDELRGDGGRDTLTGGPGSDRFVIGENGTDRITDFGVDDTLVLAELIDPGPDPDGAALDDFLQFAFDGADTTLGIDRDGAGDLPVDVTVVFQGADLVAGAPSPAAAIDNLLASGQLEIA